MEKKTEIIAGEEVPVITAEQPEKKQRKKRSDAGMKRGERNEKPAAKKKAAKKEHKPRAQRYTAKRNTRIGGSLNNFPSRDFKMDVPGTNKTVISYGGFIHVVEKPQPYRILGGAIAGVFRHHKEQLKRVNWKKLAVPAAAIFIPVVVAFFAGWAFGASR